MSRDEAVNRLQINQDSAYEIILNLLEFHKSQIIDPRISFYKTTTTKVGLHGIAYRMMMISAVSQILGDVKSLTICDCRVYLSLH